MLPPEYVFPGAMARVIKVLFAIDVICAEDTSKPVELARRTKSPGENCVVNNEPVPTTLEVVLLAVLIVPVAGA